ncbi:hypothetical protein CHUAL_005466 [Chamberlinius hualienensis]
MVIMLPPILQSATENEDDKAQMQQQETINNVSEAKKESNGVSVIPSVNGKAEKNLYTDLGESKERCTLPLQFTVKYLGRSLTDGLWGTDNTRKQVESIVETARTASKPPPIVIFRMEESGVTLAAAPDNRNPDFCGGFIPIEFISYGVQDQIYTRIFAMIFVTESDSPGTRSPFECVAFACESAAIVHKLTKGLAESFKRFAKTEDQRLAILPSNPEEVINLKYDTEIQDSNA